VHSIVSLLASFGSPKKQAVTVGLLSALLVATPATSGVYKYIDENGQVAYSDKPVEGAKKLKIRSRNGPSYASQPSKPANNEQSGEADNNGFKYESFELLTPKEDKVVSDRSGSVQVVFLPEPALAADHEIIVNVDGKDISRGRHANISLSQVPRGSHKVTGRIESAEGKVLITSATVTFHVKRPIIDEDSPLAFGN